MHVGAYPTPAQVSIFLGDIWVDDAYRIEYRSQNNKYPLYGFNEPRFSAVAMGQKLITGNIILSFRFPGYLQAAVEEVLTQHDPTLVPHADLAKQLLEASTINDRIQLLDQARREGVEDLVAQQLEDLFTSHTSSMNRASHQVSDINPQFEFDVTIKYGGGYQVGKMKVLEGVRFTGESQTISAAANMRGDSSSSGMPIYEIHSFIARDIKDQVARVEHIPVEEDKVKDRAKLPAVDDLVI